MFNESRWGKEGKNVKCYSFYGSAWHKVLPQQERIVTLQLVKSAEHGVDVLVNGTQMPAVISINLSPDHPFPQFELRMCMDVLVWDESILSDCNLSEQLREDLERLGEEAGNWEAVPLAKQSTEPREPRRKEMWPIVLISIATALAANAELLWLGL